MVEHMGLENYSYILYYFTKINKWRFLAIYPIVNKKKIGHSKIFCVKANPIKQKTACAASVVRDFLLTAILP